VSFLETELATLEKNHLRRHMRTHRGCPGRLLEVEDRDVLNFSSNNYLCLAGHPALAQGASEALVAGAGSTASRLVTGNLDLHENLEGAIASLHAVEGARLFGSGYQANLGLLSSIANREDLVVSDQLNHASIIDGIRLSGATCRIADHASVDSVRKHLRNSRQFRRRFVVTDSVFSMDGDSPDLVSLRALCDEFDAFFIVDEAHAVACLGSGAGLCAERGVRPDALTSGLGKALGSYGGYVAGSRSLVEYLLNRARSFVFSTALPPAVLGAGLAALKLSRGDEGKARRASLSARIAQLRSGLEAMGRLEPGSGESAIFPIIVGEATEAMTLGESLLDRGLFCSAIRPPTVAPGTSRLRVALCADHTAEDIALLLSSLRQIL